MSVFNSEGTKRKIASALAIVLEAAKETHWLSFLIPYVNSAAGVFGIAGLVHALVEKNFADHKLVSLASLMSSLALAAIWVPQLAPLAPLVTKLAGLLGAAGLGASLNNQSK